MFALEHSFHGVDEHAIQHDLYSQRKHYFIVTVVNNSGLLHSFLRTCLSWLSSFDLRTFLKLWGSVVPSWPQSWLRMQLRGLSVNLFSSFSFSDRDFFFCQCACRRPCASWIGFHFSFS